MAVITEKELSPNAKSLWLKATSALETRNYGYAISLLQAILKESPAFLIGRQWLRRAEIASTKSGKGFMKGLSGSSIQVMKAQSLVKKDPKAAMVSAEEILEKEPHNVAANGLLKDAALAAGMPEVAGFALETMRDAEPKNAKIMHELARHYVSVDEPTKAIDVYNAIVALNPADIEATKRGKDAAAQASMRSGNWDQVGKEGVDYRNMLKNKDEAVSLEQANRLIKSADVIDQQLSELSAAYEENPNNLDVVRKIADLHEKKDDLEGALQYYQWAVELTKGGDPGLVRKVSELSMKNIETQISTRENWLHEYREALAGGTPDEEGQASITQVEQDLAAFQAQRAELLIDTARKRVERNPTDLSFRFELGEQLVKAGHITEAITELQKAQNSPSLGVRAKYLLAQCFESKNIPNLAVKQYEDARSKLPTMEGLKKDVVYKLGLLYGRTGDKDKYLACMTEIYEVDSGYLDVAARVEGGYSDAA